jgi:metal-sulfur cluster biosynthetic enzyme
MTEEPGTEAVEAKVAEVTHPEIDATLVDLGMIDDVTVEDGSAIVTLALPMLNIPDAVKQILVSRITSAVEETGAECSVDIAVMDDRQRAAFFEMEQENWSGGLDESAGEESDPPF